MKIDKSKHLFKQALHHIPGGVNSPVRAFKSVGGDPIFFESAKGAYLYDVDGNSYIDLVNSWGPMILGHRFQEAEDAIIEAVRKSTSFGAPSEAEVKMADLICAMIPSIEKVRMVNSGTEATMSAVRLARGFTGRDKIVKFEGNYHGHGDSFLIAAGSGAMTMGSPDSPGVTKGTAKDTLLAKYNDLSTVVKVVEENPGQIAAIIIEPVAGNMGCIAPPREFLVGLRDLCDKNNIILIFDEVMTGFRLSRGGAQELYDVIPDLTTLGKIIGGGMPVGAYGGKAEIMDYVSPSGPVYQAGTLAGNPVAMAAGYAVLSHLNANPEIYTKLEETTNKILLGLRASLDKYELDNTINQIGSMYTLFFTDQKVKDFESAKTCDTKKFGTYFRSMLEKGIYLAPSQFESLFLSAALGEEEIELIIKANDESLEQFSLVKV
ncbi:MAG: glutamate-1-semialdehyde 2,1-aminomutase [Cyclobacteriaceae bacterium]|jgi:glutamate-1-semialdehyde 2,1-aminomutase